MPSPESNKANATDKSSSKDSVDPEMSGPFVPSAQSLGDELDGLIHEIDKSSEADSSDDESLDNDNESLSDSEGFTDAEDSNSDSSESEESESSELSDEKSTNKDGFKKGLQKVKDQRDEAREESRLLKDENAILKEKLDSIEQRLNELSGQKDEKPSSKEDSKANKAYSDRELANAIKMFMDENDPEGLMEVINYKVEQSEKKLRDQYAAEQRKAVEIQQRRNAEWQTIVKDYSPDGYQNESIKNDPSFDIRNNKSELYVEAEKLYLAGVEKGNRRYLIEGGMSNAVQDAFVKLLQKRFGQKSSKKAQEDSSSDETEGLKRRLAKERRKHSLSDGASSVGDGDTQKPQKKSDDLSDYLAERSKEKNARMGIPV